MRLLRGPAAVLSPVLGRGVIVAGPPEGAVRVAFERDHVGPPALLEVASADLPLFGAKLPGPIAPDATDTPPDGAEDQRENENAKQPTGHRPNLDHRARSSIVAASSAARPIRGSWKRLRLGTIKR